MMSGLYAPPLQKVKAWGEIASAVRHPFESGDTINVVRVFPQGDRHANAGFCPTDEAGLIRGVVKTRAISAGPKEVYNEGEDVSRARFRYTRCPTPSRRRKNHKTIFLHFA